MATGAPKDALAAASAHREKAIVAASSVGVAVLLTTMKLVVGVATGSLGLLSEAAHSGLDLVAAAVTFFAVRASARPADAGHNYGHGKVENLSALFETFLLLITCVWIVSESISRLFFEDVEVAATPWSFIVMAISIVADFSRSRALRRMADKHHSQALEADAIHFATDIWSSAVVIVGLGCIVASEQLGLPWLAKADAVAALGVAAIVVWVSIQLGKRTLGALLDAVPAGLVAQGRSAAQVDGVLEVRSVRMRQVGPEVFADMTIAVRPGAGLEEAHAIASAAEAAVAARIPGVDVVVHVEPDDHAPHGLVERARALASRHGLGAHAVRVTEAEGRCSVELHLEVDDALTVRAAHDRVTAFEAALQTNAPEVALVVTHIEPRGSAQAHRVAVPAHSSAVEAALEALRANSEPPFEAHEIRVVCIGGELTITFHCVVAADLSIGVAHALTERLEKGLRLRVPNLGRVVIHVEPPEEPVTE